MVFFFGGKRGCFFFIPVKRAYVQLSSPDRQQGWRVSCLGMGGWVGGVWGMGGWWAACEVWVDTCILLLIWYRHCLVVCRNASNSDVSASCVWESVCCLLVPSGNSDVFAPCVWERDSVCVVYWYSILTSPLLVCVCEREWVVYWYQILMSPLRVCVCERERVVYW